MNVPYETVHRPHFESRPLAVSVAGLVGVLVIHALLVLSFVLNLALPTPRHPNITGAGATPLVSSAEPEMTAVFIDEPSPTEHIEAAPLASRSVTPPDLRVMVLSPDPSPAATTNANRQDSNEFEDTSASVEAAEHARLYGRYLGQLQARIERAWMRPRSEIGAPQFSCRARIQQDRRGHVLGIGLDHCNGRERWQQSLMSAIRTASPLPAPPDTSVYADVLWLSFSSEPFKEGGSTQGFEPGTRASATESSVLESFKRFAGDASDNRRPDENPTNVIHLTIIGTAPDAPPPPSPSELPAAPRIAPESADLTPR